MMEKKINLSFHGEDVVPQPPENALFHIIPAPMEQSVSYGRGTGGGPAAILKASYQLETLTCGVIPSDEGMYTAPFIDCGGPAPEVIDRIRKCVSYSLDHGAIPILLGGEHTVTCGAIAALAEHGEDFGVIQFDAHADLRDTYEGSKYSHACVMRRVHERGIPIYQIGTRSYSLEERDYRAQEAIPHLDAETIWRNGHNLTLPGDFPKKVYITFDLDGLDCSIMAATGTPVPGGLSWYQAMWMIEQIMESRICTGFDVVELAPHEQYHSPDFLAAQLTYNMMASITKSAVNRTFWKCTS